MALFLLKGPIYTAAEGLEQPGLCKLLCAVHPGALPSCRVKWGVWVLHVWGCVLQLLPGLCWQVCLQ